MKLQKEDWKSRQDSLSDEDILKEIGGTQITLTDIKSAHYMWLRIELQRDWILFRHRPFLGIPVSRAKVMECIGKDLEQLCKRY
jgi:hypothetical protein